MHRGTLLIGLIGIILLSGVASASEVIGNLTYKYAYVTNGTTLSINTVGNPIKSVMKVEYVLQNLDNSGGGVWQRFVTFPIETPPTTWANYKIVINGPYIYLYNVTGYPKAVALANDFWTLVNKTWLTDLRIFTDKGECYYWIEWPEVSNFTVQTINTTAGINKAVYWLTTGDVVGSYAWVNVTVKNNMATTASFDLYVNGNLAGSFSVSASSTESHSIKVPSSYFVSGANNITVSAVGTVDTADVQGVTVMYCSDNEPIIIWVNLTAGSTELNIAYGNPSALQSSYNKANKTLIFGDDFNTNDLGTTWIINSNYGTITIENGLLELIQNTGTTGGQVYAVLPKALTNSFVFLVKAKFNLAVYGRGISIVDNSSYSSRTNDVRIHGDTSGRNPAIIKDEGGTGTTLYNFPTLQSGIWHTYMITVNSSGGLRAYVDGSLVTTSTFSPTQPLQYIDIGNDAVVSTSGDWTDIYVDYVIVAKYGDPANFGTPIIGKLVNVSIGSKSFDMDLGSKAVTELNLASGLNTLPIRCPAYVLLNVTVNVTYSQPITPTVTKNDGKMSVMCDYTTPNNITNFSIFIPINETVWQVTSVYVNGNTWTDYTTNSSGVMVRIPTATSNSPYNVTVDVEYNNPPIISVESNFGSVKVGNTWIVRSVIGKTTELKAIVHDPENNTISNISWNLEGMSSNSFSVNVSFDSIGVIEGKVTATDDGYVQPLSNSTNVTVVVVKPDIELNYPIVIGSNYILINGFKIYIPSNKVEILPNAIKFEGVTINASVSEILSGNPNAIANLTNMMSDSMFKEFAKTLKLGDLVNLVCSGKLSNDKENIIIDILKNKI